VSTAAPVLPWPFLTVLMTSAPATKGGDGPEPPRVRGLGVAVGDHVVTAAHVAEGSDVALFADGSQLALHAEARTYSGVSLVGTAGSWGGPELPVADVAEGQAVTIAVVSDISPSAQLIEGRAGPTGPDGTFTIDLSTRLSEDATASGSPVYADGALVGIVGPTATSSSVDAIDADAFRSLLSPPPTPDHTPGAPAQDFDLAGGVSSDLVDPTTGLALDRDRLGLGVDVTMFATLIADVTTPMPLSIGLFGEWGSGKSTFMAMLRHEIDRLSQSEDPRYRSDVVQIGFNAWHYADSNLWASLGDEIFEQLAGPQGETTALRREALRTALAGRLRHQQELQAAQDRAQEETRRLTAELESATADRHVSAGTLAKAVLGSPELRAQLEPAFRRLGIGEDDRKVKLLTDELEATPSDVFTLRDAVAGIRPWAWLAAALAVAAVVVAAVLAWDEIGGILAAVPAIAAVAGAVLARAHTGARMLHQVAGEIRLGHEARVAGQLEELKQAQTKERVLQTQLDETIEQVGALGRELAELTPGRRLYSFVADRAASDAYRSQLGLISTIRKDFEQLAALMKEWREAGGEDDAKRPIDRIVLYIDDLDRCSPQQVVDVLQAVHLLLALDLFVVVVGVDPRWLLHSLRREYRSMLTAGVPDDEDAARWETTPQDYLEKIFNIPFALPGMTAAGFGQLVGSLAETEGPLPAGSETDASRAAATAQAEAPVATPAEPGSEVVQVHDSAMPVERRPLTRDELAMLTALAPLVRTPRETKRLVNLYRMMRSTRDLSPASRFLGDGSTPGEYEAVVILLGILSGHAQLLPKVLAALTAAPATQTWAAFAQGLAPGDADAEEAEAWTRLSAGLQDATARVTIPDLAPFQVWAPRIARFSFRGG
jgi:hypothetical protein